MNPLLAEDMAGNVREWCVNASGDDRCTLGGAWNDPPYLFLLSDARPPMDRSSGNGFRCAKYEVDPPRDLTEPVDASLVAAGHSADRRGPAGDRDRVIAHARVEHHVLRQLALPAAQIRRERETMRASIREEVGHHDLRGTD